MENNLTPEQEDMLDKVFGISPERKKAKLERERKEQANKPEPDPDSVEAQVRKFFGSPKNA